MSRSIRILFVFSLFVFSLFVFACSSMHVSVDYDKGNDFSRYTKYKWIKQKNTDDHQSIYKNDLNKKRFAEVVATVLKKKGYERTTDDDYEFSIVYYLRFDKKVDVTAYGYKYYPRSGYTERYVQTKVYQQGSIIIDIIDREQKILVWRGAVEGVLRETDDSEQVIKNSVKEILKDFPPRPKK